MNTVKRALISVYDKTGLADFVGKLSDNGIDILSTGGTAKLLTDAGIKVTEVADYTEAPEIMDGRVKTLHPKIHGGILARAGIDDEIMVEQGIATIDLVVVNLYPFEATIKRPDCTLNEAIENIDIGGPTILRAAAKNHTYVGAVVDIADYQKVLDELSKNNGMLSDEIRFYLAQKAFAHTANYEANISNYLAAIQRDGSHLDYPLTFSMQFKKLQDLRYGENPHQTSALYAPEEAVLGSLVAARQLQGKALSYNNIADADVAFKCVNSYRETACVIVKHANPCGIALGIDNITAYTNAYHSDPSAAFGGVIAFNRALDKATAAAMTDRRFVEVVIAPTVDADALAVFAGNSNIRILETGQLRQSLPVQLDMKPVSGGLLLQDSDQKIAVADDLKVVSQRAPTEEEIADMLFAWRAIKYVKSNAIIYAKDRRTLGMGAGQSSRVYSVRIATMKAKDAGLGLRGAVMASDAFFPFRDGVDLAAKAGISAVVQPGGSLRDDEVLAAVDENNMAMVFTCTRHFLH